MTLTATALISFLILQSNVYLPFVLSKTAPEVDTSFGRVRGIVEPSPVPSLGRVYAYLGIPYGMSPTGKNRFTMPQTTPRWSNTVLEATKLPPVCIQILPEMLYGREGSSKKTLPATRYNYLQRLQPQLLNQDESCLYLNIYAPADEGGRDGASFPVLVLVHGESYEWNAGNPYKGTVLASYGKVVVITLNYRLGVFGFLSSGDATCRGNWGLSDVVCALQFIKDIIQPFGGDPNAITVLGWGTGAALVNLLMASPMSAHSPCLAAGSRLFKRAILLGGSSLGSWSTVKNPAENFYMLAEKLGCPTQESEKGKRALKLIPSEDVLNCIKAQSVDNITLVAAALHRPTFLNVFGPVIDSTFVLMDPATNLEQQGSLFQQLDLMVGLTTNEAHDLLTRHQLEYGVDQSEQERIIRTLVRNLFQYHRAQILEAVKNQYTDWKSPGQHPMIVRDSILSALGDCLYAAPLIKTAKMHAQAGSKRSNTFLYVFNYETKGWNRGSVHGAFPREDLLYVLGYPLLAEKDMTGLPYNGSYGKTERTISELMMRYVSNFVKSGNPNEPVKHVINNRRFQDLRWAPFEHEKEAFIEIDETPRDDGVYYRAKDVAFWNKFLPQLDKSDSNSQLNSKHHLLPDHFVQNSYYGSVKPHGSYFNIPYPSPLPPTPVPKEVTTMLQDGKNKGDGSTRAPKSDGSSTAASGNVNGVEYSTILSITVAVGCALLVLNILIFAGIYHQRDKQRRQKKQMQLQYQSYDTTGMGPNSPLTPGGPRMPPAPPPPASQGMGVSPGQSIALDGDLHPTLQNSTSNNYRAPGGVATGGTPSGSMMRTFQQQHQHHLQHHVRADSALSGTPSMNRNAVATYPEQEPLLSTAQLAPRQVGVSPTCPRHGRAAMQAQAGGPVEEIQV